MPLFRFILLVTLAAALVACSDHKNPSPAVHAQATEDKSLNHVPALDAVSLSQETPQPAAANSAPTSPVPTAEVEPGSLAAPGAEAGIDPGRVVVVAAQVAQNSGKCKLRSPRFEDENPRNGVRAADLQTLFSTGDTQQKQWVAWYINQPLENTAAYLQNLLKPKTLATADLEKMTSNGSIATWTVR